MSKKKPTDTEDLDAVEHLRQLLGIAGREGPVKAGAINPRALTPDERIERAQRAYREEMERLHRGGANYGGVEEITAAMRRAGR